MITCLHKNMYFGFLLHYWYVLAKKQEGGR